MFKKYFFQVHTNAAEAQTGTDGKKVVMIEGYASTPNVNRYREIIKPEAFAGALERYMTNPVLLRSHDMDRPAGVVVATRLTEKGLWIQARVNDEQSQAEILDGRMRTLSIGWIPLETTLQHEDGSAFDPANDNPWASDMISVVSKLDLVEISLVTTPADAFALFDIAASVKSFFRGAMLRKNCFEGEPTDAGTPHVISQADIDANPDLLAAGVKVGDTVYLPIETRETATTAGTDAAPAPAPAAAETAPEIKNEPVEQPAEQAKPKEEAEKPAETAGADSGEGGEKPAEEPKAEAETAAAPVPGAAKPAEQKANRLAVPKETLEILAKSAIGADQVKQRFVEIGSAEAAGADTLQGETAAMVAELTKYAASAGAKAAELAVKLDAIPAKSPLATVGQDVRNAYAPAAAPAANETKKTTPGWFTRMWLPKEE